jgi:hypothetical protein
MATPDPQRDLTLLGLPQELLLKILKHVFEDWGGPCYGYESTMVYVDLEILQVSRLLYIEGEKALRSRLQETGMYYSHDSPPKQLDKNDVDTANDEDDNEYVKECNAHIRSLKQYGDCFETLYIHWCQRDMIWSSRCTGFPTSKKSDSTTTATRLKLRKTMATCKMGS